MEEEEGFLEEVDRWDGVEWLALVEELGREIGRTFAVYYSGVVECWESLCELIRKQMS